MIDHLEVRIKKWVREAWEKNWPILVKQIIDEENDFNKANLKAEQDEQS